MTKRRRQQAGLPKHQHRKATEEEAEALNRRNAAGDGWTYQIEDGRLRRRPIVYID